MEMLREMASRRSWCQREIEMARSHSDATCALARWECTGEISESW